jgi:hypothetical protein
MVCGIIRGVGGKLDAGYSGSGGGRNYGTGGGAGEMRWEKMKANAPGTGEARCRKGRGYAGIIMDKGRDTVAVALPGRKTETASEWFTSQKTRDFSELESISMDMSGGFIKTSGGEILGGGRANMF